MRQQKVIYNAYSLGTTAISAVPSVEISAQNIEQLKIGLMGQGTGTTASTLATTLAELGNIKLTVGGEIETLVLMSDLFALNYVLEIQPILSEVPTYLLSTTTDNTNAWITFALPVFLTSDKKVYFYADAGTVAANTDNPVINLIAVFGDKPFGGKPWAVKYQQVNTATQWINPVDISLAGRKILGILAFSTTVTSTSASAGEASAGEIKILVNKSEKVHTAWYSLPQPQCYIENTTLQAILVKYRWIDCMDDPIPADNVQITCKSLYAATDAVRFIVVYQ